MQDAEILVWYCYHPISSVQFKHHCVPLIQIPAQFVAKLFPLLLGKQGGCRYTCYRNKLYNMLTVKYRLFAFGYRFMISTAHSFDL